MRQVLWKIAGVSFLALVCIVPVATAAPDPSSGKLTYAESVDSTGALTVSFDESGQKRFASVDYRLDATGTATWDCGGQPAGNQFQATNTATGLVPDSRGHVVGTLTLQVAPLGSSNCTSLTLTSIAWTNVTLTNLTSGHVYHLNSASRTF